MKKFVSFVILALLVAVSSVAMAATLTVVYQEPATTVAGTTLFNLKETTIYWKQDGGAEHVVTVPASNPSGGALRTTNITVADPPTCGSTSVTVQVTASNTNATNFESVRTAAVSATKNVSGDPACSTPVAPFNLTITLP